MLSYFYHLSNFALFVYLSTFFIIFSWIAIFFVRRFVPLDLRYRDNPVIGNISALISIIYGVLVGLMALYLVNILNATEEAVQREANALAGIYRDSRLLAEPTKSRIESNIKNYINYVINVEWELMKKGEQISSKSNYLNLGLTRDIFYYPQKTSSETMLLTDMLTQVKSFYDAREQRILVGNSALTGQIWLVIFIGTFLTVMINYIYGMHFRFHILLVTAVALIASTMLFLLLTLDRPFQGEYIVEPEAFRKLESYINSSYIENIVPEVKKNNGKKS